MSFSEKGDVSKIWRGDQNVGEEANDTEVHVAHVVQKNK